MAVNYCTAEMPPLLICRLFIEKIKIAKMETGAIAAKILKIIFNTKPFSLK
ncbi:hypothetical protein [uncultured Nostoc sp.]|uniref:hypothetical protein n=1 Tax=uncultured Nostoc sp. TaxID=340711 RepID=UPI0035CAA146